MFPGNTYLKTYRKTYTSLKVETRTTVETRTIVETRTKTHSLLPHLPHPRSLISNIELLTNF